MAFVAQRKVRIGVDEGENSKEGVGANSVEGGERSWPVAR